MTRWIRQLFRSTPTSPVVKSRRTTLGLQQLEERETPATFNVTNTADSGTGSLRAAVALANSTAGADTITFAAGLGPVVLTTAQLTLTDAATTTISGPFGGTQEVQRSDAGGTPNFRIFNVAGGASAIFSNLTISNGNVAGDSGGGIENRGTLTVFNSTVSGNTASSYGGGIENTGTGTLNVTNSTVSGNNSTNFGGGIDNDGTLTVTNSTISGNTSKSTGGGIWAQGTATLTNVTITGNRSDSDDNNAAETGGGLFRQGGTVTLNSTLIAGNFRGTGTTRDDVGGTLAAASKNNLIGDGTNLVGISNGSQGNLIGTGAVPIDAKLGTLDFSTLPDSTFTDVTQTHALLAGSPAINAGSNAAALTTDQRGFVRVMDGNVDIGAVEMQRRPGSFLVDNTNDFIDGNYAVGQLTLRESALLANETSGANTITFAAGLGAVMLTSRPIVLTDTTGVTTVSGPASGTQVVTSSTAPGTQNIRIFNVNGGASAVFNNLTITNGNSTLAGGGIYNDFNGTLTINNSTISGNTSTFDGGGIANLGTLTVTNSTISGNNSPINGGGISSVGTLTVTNSTISGNTSITQGGGVSVNGGTVTLTNVTITSNRSDSDNAGAETGGGLFLQFGTVSLNNTLIAGNFRGTGTTRDDVFGGPALLSANNLIGDGTGLTNLINGSQGNMIGTGASPIDPQLLLLSDYDGVTLTHALGLNSPALGKGSATVAGYSVYDQRGASRDNGTPDIGAYEVNHPLAPVGVPTTLGGLFQPKPSASANEAFVKGLYQSTLLRAPDAAGLAGWLSQLAGGTSRSVVANGFVNSTENRRNQVTFFYRYFLSREPDTAGLNGWVSILQGGRDEGEVMTGFILSNEFSGLVNNSQFVNLMYYALLSRQADTAGFNGWLNAINGGQSRGVVVNAFLRSEEGLNRVIDSFFQTYLKRYGSAGDLGAFRTFLATNTFGQAATLILSSAEFFTNATANQS